MQLHRSSGRHGLGLALAGTTVFFWGALPLALKSVLRSLDVWTIVWFRLLVSAVVVGAILAVRGGLPRLGRLNGLGRLLLLLAFGGLGANYVLYMRGLDLTTPATAQVVIQLSPPLLAVGGLFVFRERFTALQWAGFLTLLTGLAVFYQGQLAALFTDAERTSRGVLWIVAAAIAWAVYGLAQKQLLVVLGSQGIMWCVYVGCALAFWPLAEPSRLADLSGVELGLLSFCALNTVVAYGAFSEALAHWEASRVSAVLALTPLATIAFSTVAADLWPAWIDPDPVSAQGFLGALLVVAGSMATALLGRRRRALPAAAVDEPAPKAPGTPRAPGA